MKRKRIILTGIIISVVVLCLFVACTQGETSPVSESGLESGSEFGSGTESVGTDTGRGETVQGETYADAGNFSAGDFTYLADKVDTLEINWALGDVTLVQNEERTLSVSEPAGDRLSDAQKMRYYLDGRTLRIEFWQSGYSGEISAAEKHLTVEIPGNLKIKINAGAGAILGEEFSAREVTFETISGKVQTDLLNANRVTVTTESGEVWLGALSCRNISVSTKSGAVGISVASCSNADISSVSGAVAFVPGSAGATVEYTTESGSYFAEDMKTVFGDGKCMVKVETVTGNLTIRESSDFDKTP